MLYSTRKKEKKNYCKNDRVRFFLLTLTYI